MQVNSRVPSSAQDGVHVQLTTLVATHLAAPFLKPYADYNRRAADESLARYARRGAGAPLILDACCGVGESSIALARAFPDHYVIGVDQSADRLARRIADKSAERLPENVDLVRADLVDYWRLLQAEGVRLARQYLLYPNPWPKIGHLARRWHGHPVFPSMLALGGDFECRSNWPIYVEEMARAITLATGRGVVVEAYAPEPTQVLTPFERKYLASGHALSRLRVALP